MNLCVLSIGVVSHLLCPPCQHHPYCLQVGAVLFLKQYPESFSLPYREYQNSSRTLLILSYIIHKPTLKKQPAVPPQQCVYLASGCSQPAVIWFVRSRNLLPMHPMHPMLSTGIASYSPPPHLQAEDGDPFPGGACAFSAQAARHFHCLTSSFFPLCRLRVVTHSLGGMGLLLYMVQAAAVGVPSRVHRAILLTPAGYHMKVPVVGEPLQPLSVLWLVL